MGYTLKDYNKAYFGTMGKDALQGAQLGSSFGAAGSIIGGLGGMVVGAVHGGNVARDEQTEYYKQQEFEENTTRENSLNNYYINANLNNTSNKPYYALGGKLNQNSRKTLLVKGKKHEQGGERFGNAIVEDGELIDGDKVYSNRLKIDNVSISDIAKHFVNKRDKFKQNNKDNFKNNTNRRNIEIINNKLNKLFIIQNQLANQQ